MDENTTPEFPQYPPRGVPIGDPRQAKPLMKLLNRMLKPRNKTVIKRQPRWKKKHKFY